jgi:hypothetical protein
VDTSTIPACSPPLPDEAFAARMLGLRAWMAALEPGCPPRHAAALADAAEAVEFILARLGRPVPAKPLTAHDLEFLAACGCPA